MFRVFSKIAVTTLMLIAFVGQSFAYNAVRCEMAVNAHKSHMTMDHSTMSHHEMMSHGMNESDMDKSSTNQSQDCCGTDCVCPANTCSSAIVLISQFSSNEIMPLKDAVNLMQSKQPSSIPTSLFRPPIFA